MWQESDESSSNGGNSDEEKKSRKSAKKNASPEKDEETKSGNESSSSKEESDSEYEEKQAPDGSNDENTSKSEESSSESDSDAASSSEDEKILKKKPSRRSGSKLDEQTRRLLESENFLRRSGRSRGSRKASSEEDQSEENVSSSEWSDDGRKDHRRSSKKQAKNAAKKATRGTAKQGQYKESSDDEEINESDVLEWEEEKPKAETNGVLTENIERIIKSRIGVPSAVGSATTCYNVAEKGDPNENGEKTDKQYLVKWVGWSHMHNTWESEASLKVAGAGGLKRLQNYQKKQDEMDAWRRTADKEYIEFFNCEQEMLEELCEEYKKVERVVAHQVSRDRAPDGGQTNEFFVKWSGLPYSDCTWEEQRLLPQQKIDEYFERVDNSKTPSKSSGVMRKRPKFVKLDEMPEYLYSPYNDSTLRDYQLMGLNWMLHAWSKGNSCILADEMGLGKTIQSISFLASLFHRYQLYGPFLVVVPLSTMSAWQKEFQQWAPAVNMVTYMGDVSSRDMIRQYEWYIPGSKKMKVNAVLTTFEILLKDKSFLGGVEWAALMVDEAHRLKNEDSLLYKCLSQFKCDHRLLITGTPLQNSLKELWALLHFIMPDEFPSWYEFECAHNDTDHKGISSLHRKLEPYLLRRVKKDVEKSLPAKVEQILRVDMTANQKQYYKWILTKNYKELSKGVKGSINGFVNLCMELKKCCNHTSLVRGYDYYEQEAHARLQQLLKSSGKLILLDKLLVRLKETGHRVLIFSQMVMMLDVVQEYLQLRRFPSQRLDGSMRADMRKAALDHFNAEGSTDFCFLLSTRAGGLGINLATADTVIIFDSDWNPQNDLQAMSRAHRIGQTKKVNIYRLVTASSVEEQIVERAKQKLVLDHLVIQRMDTTGRTVLSKSSATGAVPFDKSELNDILKFGAAELFKEKEGEEQEPEVDIDRILMGAETRECENENENDNELLSAFKYANFAIDEEKDIAMAGKKREVKSATSEEGGSWDDIIPEEERRKIEEEERQKELQDLNLAPRQRTKLVNGNDEDDGGEDSDASSSGSINGKRGKRKKAFGDFSNTEIKRLIRSFKKFAHPLERLEAIAQDAELEEHSTEELKKVAEALLEGCLQSQAEYNVKGKKEEESEAKDKAVDEASGKVRDRGPQFKFAGTIDVNVRPLLKGQAELEPLHMAFNAAGSEDDFTLPPNTRSQKGWDIPWVSLDDLALLKGVYRYGMGSWESIKMDPALGLADKIYLKDKVKKPQPKHLQARVEYILKLLKTGKSRTSSKKSKKAELKRKSVSSANPIPKERKRKAEEGKKPEKKKAREDKEKTHKVKDGHITQPSGSNLGQYVETEFARLQINSDLYARYLNDTTDHPFKDCVKMLKPVQKYIKKLSGEHSEKDGAKYLLRIGDCGKEAIVSLIKKDRKLQASRTFVEKQINYIFIFLSKFIALEPAILLEKYRKLSSGTRHHKHKHGGGSPKEGHKEKEKHREKEQHKKDEKQNHKEHHHKDKEQHNSSHRHSHHHKESHHRKERHRRDSREQPMSNGRSEYRSPTKSFNAPLDQNSYHWEPLRGAPQAN